jgi:ergothioneine biosynthesis protein EgtB
MRRAGRDEIADALLETRDRTWRVIDALDPARLTVPRLETVNPPHWEVGHVGWFQERWCLREPPRAGMPLARSRLPDADRWFDSAVIAHDDRWDAGLPPLPRLRAWMDEGLQRTLGRLRELPDGDAGLYFPRLALFHEQFHLEAFAWTWQTLGLPRPAGMWTAPPVLRLLPDARLEGGTMMLGSAPEDGFAFDNELPAHPVRVAPFEISMQPVTNAEYLQFVEDEGYRRARFWPADAFSRVAASGRNAPAHWRRVGDRWQSRWFGQWRALESFEPVMQVDAFEAEAYCAWAGRRLPTETEWEMAAATLEDFDWGESVWEWTATPHLGFAGFVPGPYRDYAAPSFGSTRVLRGGSFATPAGLPHLKLRNFFRPDRNDVFAGFRTCARR